MVLGGFTPDCLKCAFGPVFTADSGFAPCARSDVASDAWADLSSGT